MFCETSKVLILATLGSHRGEEVGGVENTLYNTTFRVMMNESRSTLMVSNILRDSTLYSVTIIYDIIIVNFYVNLKS